MENNSTQEQKITGWGGATPMWIMGEDHMVIWVDGEMRVEYFIQNDDESDSKSLYYADCIVGTAYCVY